MSDQVSIFEIWQALLSQWRLVAVSAALTTVLAALWALMATPVYRAEVLVAPVDNSAAESGLGALAGQFGGLASLAGLDLRSNQGKEEALAVLSSRRFTKTFIETNNLMPVLFEEKWDAQRNAWTVDSDEQIPTLQDAHKLLTRKLRKISEDPESGLIRISIDWKDRELAAEWANLTVRQINEEVRASAIREAEKSIEYLTEELEKTSIVGLQQAIFGVIEGQINIATLANVRDEYAFKVIDPAVIPDVDREVWPKKLLLLIVGFAIGVMGGALIALIRTAKVLNVDRVKSSASIANS